MILKKIASKILKNEIDDLIRVAESEKKKNWLG